MSAAAHRRVLRAHRRRVLRDRRAGRETLPPITAYLRAFGGEQLRPGLVYVSHSRQPFGTYPWGH